MRAYVHNEETLLVRSTTPPQFIDKTIEDQERILSEVSEAGIFKLFPTDENERRRMREGALNAAKEFWVNKLEEPNLAGDAAAFGRRRISEITQKVEELNRPPQNPA